MLKKVLMICLTLSLMVFMSITAFAYGWKQESKGWRYYYEDNILSYYKDSVELIDGKKYSFNEEGYMVTGWEYILNWGTWYYFESNGEMRFEPYTVDGITYYFNSETGECLNPDGRELSKYELEFYKWFEEVENADIIELESVKNNIPYEQIQKSIEISERIIQSFGNLPKDVPISLKLQYAYLAGWMQYYQVYVDSLKEITASLESNHTDYQELLQLYKKYRKAYTEMENYVDEFFEGTPVESIKY